MPSVNIENGKRIEDLVEISTFSASAHFLVSEHNLTRKTTLTSLRNMFNGDTATEDLNNLYYSVEKINEIINNVNDEFSKLTERIDSLNLKIQDIYTNLGADLDEFKKKLELMYNELLTANGDLYKYINEQLRIEKEARENADTSLEDKINAEIQYRKDEDKLLSESITNLDEMINNIYNSLSSAITDEINNRINADNLLQAKINANTENIVNLSSEVNNISSDLIDLTDRVRTLELKISYGTSAPTSLENGKIYLQYF